jgi:uncharacterized protein YcbK (DUF882 family)
MMMCLTVIMLAFFAFPADSAKAETRTLKLYYLHTGEKAEITFKRNGRYVKSGLKKINHFLRDWRRNEPTKMNPRLLDLIWEVYKETRSRKHIHVISGYRSPATNSLLRKRGRGVARKSQHTLGNALDFFIPGVSLRKLRDIGLKKGLGGVGYYPKSGSPFVHMDTGRVRHWPRMSRKQLVKVFPRGKTLHVPSDGKPLPGYDIAKAKYQRAIKGIKVPSASEIAKKPSLFAKLFSRDNDEDAGISGASRVPKPVKAKKVTPPKPAPTPKTPEPAIATPEPVPAKPEPELAPTPEAVIASLAPSQIPVPVLAPRIAVAKPPEPAPEPVPTPEVVPVPEVAETQVASLEEGTADEDLPANAEALEQVAVAVPVPVRRPALEVAPQPTSELALAQPTPAARQATEIAALSANEISDLRQQVYATLESSQPTQPEAIPFKPATQANTQAPVQLAEQVPFQPPTKLETSDVPSLIQSASSAISEQLNTNGSASTGTANNGSQTTSPQLVTALLPVEPDLRKQNGIIVPTQSPVAGTQTQEAPSSVETNTNLENGIPVPKPAIRSKRQLAKAEPIVEPVAAPKPSSSDPIETAASKKKTGTLSIQEFKTANLDERLTGKWALENNTSIKNIADIRPPAYGRSILRERPSSVLSSGFSQNQIGERTTGFAGSSMEFLEFKNFE